MDQQLFLEEAILVVDTFYKEVAADFLYRPSSHYTYCELASRAGAWMQSRKARGDVILNTRHGWDNGITIDGIIVSVVEGAINITPTGPDFDLGYEGQIIWEGSLNERRRMNNEDTTVGTRSCFHLDGWGWVSEKEL